MAALQTSIQAARALTRGALASGQQAVALPLSQLGSVRAFSGHGHSHGGVPCHGHGQPAKQPQQPQHHGHSHGGVPCHGHSHGPTPQQQPVQAQHGHSHGGVPCHGHHHGSPPAARQHAHLDHFGPCSDHTHGLVGENDSPFLVRSPGAQGDIPEYEFDEAQAQAMMDQFEQGGYDFQEPQHIDVRVAAPKQDRSRQVWTRMVRLPDVRPGQGVEALSTDFFPVPPAETGAQPDLNAVSQAVIGPDFVWEVRVDRDADVYELLNAVRFVQEGWLGREVGEGLARGWGCNLAIQVLGADGKPVTMQPGMKLSEVLGEEFMASGKAPVFGWCELDVPNPKLEADRFTQDFVDFWLRVPGSTPFMRMIQDNKADEVRQYLESSDEALQSIHDSDLIGMTPLLYSILFTDDTRCLEALLENGAIPSEEQASLGTSLIMMALDNQVASGAIIRTLVEQGGLDPDTKEVDISALSMAVFEQREDAVQALLELGATRLTGLRGPSHLIEAVRDSFEQRGLPMPDVRLPQDLEAEAEAAAAEQASGAKQ